MVESKRRLRRMEAWMEDNEFDHTVLFRVPAGTVSVDSQSGEVGGGLKVRVAGDVVTTSLRGTGKQRLRGSRLRRW